MKRRMVIRAMELETELLRETNAAGDARSLSADLAYLGGIDFGKGRLAEESGSPGARRGVMVSVLSIREC